tara:strand:- start:274 stop:732 length:459 start_codon:yes stop_codon:yes gene_type:complete
MTTSGLLKKINNYFLSINEVNNNNIYFLEETREKIIDQIRADEKELIDLVNMNKNNKIEDKYFSLKKFKIRVNFSYNTEKIEEKKEELKKDILEIMLIGKKVYKVFDLVDQNKKIDYNLTPTHGIVFSSKTHISSSTFANSMILSIIIENEI